jgi:nucleoid DNA-binding protein
MRYAKSALGGLVTVLALGLVMNVDAQAPAGKKASVGKPIEKKTTPPNLQAGLVSATKEKKETVEKILKALGPAFSEQLRAGREVELSGVGTFRVVQVAEHKDLVGGRPTTIPAKNYVEFLPTGTLNAEANSPTARPSKVVPPGDFIINPNSTPSSRSGTTRNLGTRTK